MGNKLPFVIFCFAVTEEFCITQNQRNAYYYAAVINKKVYLVNKMTVKELFQAFESVTGEKVESESAETADPETNASAASGDSTETEMTETSEDAEE